MKRFILGWLAGAMCLASCVGCAYLKPSEEQRAAADARPWGGAGKGEEPEEHLAADIVGAVIELAK